MFRRCSERNLKGLERQKVILYTAWKFFVKKISYGTGRLGRVLGVVCT